MKVVQILAVLTVLLPGYLLASENPACSSPDSTYIDSSATTLRKIAVTCTDSEIARLFYNRAYHKDLLAEEKVLSGLDTVNDESRYEITAYRLYIALLEELAPFYFPELGQRVSFLNQVYEKRGEVVELRIRGYDKLADALERKLMF